MPVLFSVKAGRVKGVNSGDARLARPRLPTVDKDKICLWRNRVGHESQERFARFIIASDLVFLLLNQHVICNKSRAKQDYATIVSGDKSADDFEIQTYPDALHHQHLTFLLIHY